MIISIYHIDIQHIYDLFQLILIYSDLINYTLILGTLKRKP